MTYRYTNKYIFAIIGFLVFFAIYLQYSIEQSTKELKRQEISKAERYADQIGKYIKFKIVKNGKLNLGEHPHLR